MNAPPDPAPATASKPPEGGAPPPGRYSFLRTSRWIRLLAGALAVSVGCTLLGVWQWNRHTARLEVVARIAANYDAPPVPLADLLVEGELAEGAAWRPARVTGDYASGSAVLLRNRPVAGTPAVHVLAVLVVEIEGRPAALVVDRGWLPADTPTAPPAPEGPVTAVVRLRPAEPGDPRTAPAGQVHAVDPAAVLAAGSAQVAAVPVRGYGVLAEEVPASPDDVRRLPGPDTGLGTHLSYTFQWWLFAVGALVGAAVLARREAEAAGGTPGPGRTPPAGGGRRRRRPTAEEEEDALLDHL